MEMITSYLKYKQSGFSCLPTGKDKMPAIPKGTSWKGGWNNQDEYKTSFGLAFIAGQISGNLECLDFDNHFGDAKEVISIFLKMEGVRDIYTKHKLPIQSTTSGGFHLLYRCSEIQGNQKLASRPKHDPETNKMRVSVLIETRGEGGYFIVSPTPGYKVVRNDILTVSQITPDERNILLSACRTFNKNVKVYNKPEEETDKPGDLFNKSMDAISEMQSVLKSDGWKELKEGIWQRPGKNKGISATLNQAAPGIFYNFSSSADPFEMEKGYTAFQVVGLLKYKGDFKQFAKELHEKYNTSQPVKEYKKPAPKTENQLAEILRKSLINLEIPVAKPPVIMRIRSRKGTEYVFNRVFTLGNFSAITGKSKSKKTFLASMFLAASLKRKVFNTIFLSDIPGNKTGVVLFDTEQSNYDAYVSAHRVWELAGGVFENFGAFDLREYSALERCDIVEQYLKTVGEHTSLIVIDGIADLATAINDEIEASRVVSLLMKWTKLYNVHIIVIIHQNKNDNYATGHLGSAILKKSECIISVTKDPDNSLRSEVSCDLIRGASDFDNFAFVINDNGLPEIEVNESVNYTQPKNQFNDF